MYKKIACFLLAVVMITSAIKISFPQVVNAAAWDLENASFEQGNLNSWGVWSNTSNSFCFVRPGGLDGDGYECVIQGTSAHGTSVYQARTGIPNGRYKASVWVKATTFAGGADDPTRFLVKDYGGSAVTANIRDLGIAGMIDTTTWLKLTINNIQVTNSQMQVEVFANCASSAEWVAMTGFNVERVLEIQDIANGLTLSAISSGQTQLVMPVVPDGYAAELTASSNTDVIDLNGKITPALSNTSVSLTFTVTENGTSNSATKVITVIVPFVREGTGVNLVPTTPNIYNVPNYVCTWSYQDWWAYSDDNPYKPTGGTTASGHPRYQINHQVLFGSQGPGGSDGWCNTMYPDIRGDMIFLLDDGWDLDTSNNGFGSHSLNTTKYPGYGSNAQERLKTLSDNIKACGWKGLGVWIYANGNEAYWREKLEWSRYAGVAYWKVDWPDFGIALKNTINRLRDEIYPELVVEHSGGGGAFNESGGPYRTHPNEVDWRVDCGYNADVFRTYDVTGPLSTASSLDRIVQHLNEGMTSGKYMGLINGEDEHYMNAALGLCMGVMRYPIGNAPLGSLPNIFFGGERFPTTRPIRNMADEVTRAAKWQRIAPAYRMDAYDTKLSNEYLADTWDYANGASGPPDLRDTWDGGAAGRTRIQRAPAVSARGIALPTVTVQSGDKPFVAASKNPSGAISVATFGRTSVWPIGYHTNDTVKVDLNCGDLTGPVGVFGIFGELKLTFNQDLTGKTVLAQDIMDMDSENITDQVEISGNSITIPGSLINGLGVSAGTPGDPSEPGLVIQIGDPSDYLPAAPIKDVKPWDIFNASFEQASYDAVNGATYANWANGESATVSRPYGWNFRNFNQYSFVRPGGRSGQYECVNGRTSGTGNFEAATYQTLSDIPNGTYNASVWVKSTTFTRSGSPTACGFFVRNFGGADKYVDIAAMAQSGQVDTTDWTQLTINGIKVTNNQIRLEIYTLGTTGQYVVFDDFELTPVELMSLTLVLEEIGGDLKAVVENGNLPDRDVILIAAIYENGRLVRTESDTGTAVGGGGIFSFATGINPEDYPGCEIKLFAWDPITFAPLTEAVNKITTGAMAFAINAATGQNAIAVSSAATIYEGTGAASGPASYTNGQKYFKGQINFPQLNTAQPFTYDIDFYTNSNRTNQYLIGVGNHRWTIKLFDGNVTSRIIQAWVRKGTGNTWSEINITNSELTAAGFTSGLTLNQWHRLTLSVTNGNTGSTAYIYLDGVLLRNGSSDSWAISTTSLYAGTEPFGLGHESDVSMDDASLHFDGYIGNVRVCDVALSSAQISADGDRVPAAPVDGQTEMFRLKLGAPN